MSSLPLGGEFYEDDNVRLEFAGAGAATVILLISAPRCPALPAVIAMPRSEGLWPQRWLRYAALIFTMLNALVDFATEGFAALANLGKGLFALAVLSYQLNLRIVEAEQGDGSVLVGVSAARPAGTR